MTGPDARQVLSLQCPRCHTSGLALPQTPGMVEPLPASGQALCRRCGARYAIHKHVLDLSQPGDDKLLTLAGLSNTLPALPWIYEHVWRPRALTLLTGASFPRAQEIALLDEWLAAKPAEIEGKRIAVERNGEIVPKGRYAATAVGPDDRFEIVAAVGGG